MGFVYPIEASESILTKLSVMISRALNEINVKNGISSKVKRLIFLDL